MKNHNINNKLINIQKSVNFKISFYSCILSGILFSLIETLFKHFTFWHILLFIILAFPSVFIISRLVLKTSIENHQEITIKPQYVEPCNNLVDISLFKNEIKSKLEGTLTFNKQIEEIVNSELMFAFLEQAQNTESATATITDYIDSLNSLVDQEDKISNKLSEAVNLLNESNIKLGNNSQEVLKISEGFLTLKNKSVHLQEGSLNILKLLEYVQNITKQIQLLSFNASIEAARAGDSGSGFTVVANEFRKLSENAKSSVDSINNNLGSFINTLNSVIKDIDMQFVTMVSKAQDFKDMTLIAHDNISEVKLIVDSLLEVKDSVLNEVNKSKNVYNKISILSNNFDAMSEISETIVEKTTHQQEHLQDILSSVDNIDTKI